MDTVKLQMQGKDHIKHIGRIATLIWQENGYNIDWTLCLQQALKRHREHLIESMSRNEMIDKGIFWKNQKTNQWEKMII